jgi:hypothetical protein
MNAKSFSKVNNGLLYRIVSLQLEGRSYILLRGGDMAVVRNTHTCPVQSIALLSS